MSVPLCSFRTWQDWVLWIIYNLFVFSCGHYVARKARDDR